MGDLQVGNGGLMQLYLCEVLGEFHRVSERPLVRADLPERSSHKNRAYLVDDEKFGDVIRVGPHDCELLSASLAVELRDAIGVTDCRDVEHRVKGRAEALVVSIPHLK